MQCECFATKSAETESSIHPSMDAVARNNKMLLHPKMESISTFIVVKVAKPKWSHTKSPLKVVSIVIVIRYFPSHTILRNALSSFIISLNSSLGGSTSTSHLFLFNCTIAPSPPSHSPIKYKFAWCSRLNRPHSLTAHRAHIKLSKYYSLMHRAMGIGYVLRERCIALIVTQRQCQQLVELATFDFSCIQQWSTLKCVILIQIKL